MFWLGLTSTVRKCAYMSLTYSVQHKGLLRSAKSIAKSPWNMILDFDEPALAVALAEVEVEADDDDDAWPFAVVLVEGPLPLLA